MQELSPEMQEKLVKPFSWPIQDEEWDLDYWTKRGFNIFVVPDESYGFVNSNKHYQHLHQQIKDQCELVVVLPRTRLLFTGMNADVKVYRVRKSPG